MTFDDEHANAAFAADLENLAQNIQPDADFKAALEERLHWQQTRRSPIKERKQKL
jgi:hypothetical protein